MLEKLLSAVPYNPSMVHELAFYSRRMREESSVRRAGVILLLLTFFIQFFAVISPPQATVAASTNDLINGGISSAADAASHCRANSAGELFGTILANYGISCDDVAKASTVSLNSTDNSKQLYSMGRLAYGKTGEQPVTISGKTYYVRYLWSWDTGASSTYQALKVTASSGATYWILYNCGNLTSVGVPAAVPQAPVPAPNFTVVKGVRQKGQTGAYYKDITTSPGQQVEFSIELYNTGNVTLKTVTFSDTLPGGLTAVPGSLAVDGKPLSALIAGFNAGPLTAGQFKRVTFLASVPTSANACGNNRYTNVVSVTADNLPAKQSSATVQACQPTQKPVVTPVAPITAPITTPAPTPTVCQYNASLPANSSDCKPCDKAVSSADSLACISVHKSASNQTQNLADANNTQAHAGDVVIYTLYAQNNGKATVKDFVFQENISDVLDYADITDYHGSTKNNNNVLSWLAQDIKAGETATQRVTVKVKDPIPQTPTSTSDGGHFDLTMTNVYGNTIDITLPGSAPKVVEAVATKLPNTGPGTSLFIGAIVVMLAGYFYSRSQLLATESQIAVQENTSGGL